MGFESNELVAEREGCLSTRKSLNDWGTVSLNSDHWDIYRNIEQLYSLRERNSI